MISLELDTPTILDAAIRCAAVLAAAVIVDVGARRLRVSARQKHALWAFAIISVLLILPFGWLLPAVPLPILPVSEGEIPTSGLGPSVEIMSPLLGLDWLAIVYCVGVMVFLTGIALTRIRLASLWRAASQTVDPSISLQLAQLCHSAGVARPVGLRLGARDQMPMTWGTLRPKILLPSSAVSWSRDQVQLVLVHELGHIVRKDHFTQGLARAARAIHWYNPLLWFAAARLKAEQEIACDEWVLRSGADAHLYARNLLDFAFRSQSHSLEMAGAAAIARKSQLEVRLEAIVTRRPSAIVPGANSAFVAAAAGLLISCLLLSASIVPVAPALAVETSLQRSSPDSNRPSPASEGIGEPRVPTPTLGQVQARSSESTSGRKAGGFPRQVPDSSARPDVAGMIPTSPGNTFSPPTSLPSPRAHDGLPRPLSIAQPAPPFVPPAPRVPFHPPAPI